MRTAQRAGPWEPQALRLGTSWPIGQELPYCARRDHKIAGALRKCQPWVALDIIMSYRKHTAKDARAAQAAWRKEHASLVAETGLPEHCFDFENWDFLLEYGFMWHGDINIDKLSIRQKAALLRLIMTRPLHLSTF